jgi:hypothetical protein
MYKDPPFPVDLVLLNVQFKILISVFDIINQNTCPFLIRKYINKFTWDYINKLICLIKL